MQSDPKLSESLLKTPSHTHTHPPLNTESYWRKRVVTSLRHAGVSVWVRRAAGIADTLLPYVHPVCSPSAGLIGTDFLQKFLQGNKGLLSRWLHRLSGSVSILRFCQQPPAPASLGYICWSWACFLLPSGAAPTARSGSVGFPHSANFTLTSYAELARSGLLAQHLLPWFFLLTSLSPTCSHPLASLACVLHVCWQPGRCVQVFPLSLNITQTYPRSS